MIVASNLNLIDGENIENEYVLETEFYILTNKRLFYINNQTGESINNPIKNISSFIVSNDLIQVDNSLKIDKIANNAGLSCVCITLLWAFLFKDLGDESNGIIWFISFGIVLFTYGIGYYVTKVLLSIIYNNQKKELTSLKVLLIDGNLLLNKLYEPKHLNSLKDLELKIMNKIINL